jgi:hypothetical protein
MPTHPDAISHPEAGDSVADLVDDAHDLMTWHTRKLDPRPKTVFYEVIAVTDSTSVYSDADLARTGLGDGSIFYRKGLTGFFDDD